MNYTLHHYVDTPLTQDDLSLTSYIATAAILKIMLQQQQQQQHNDTNTKRLKRSNNLVRCVLLNKRRDKGVGLLLQSLGIRQLDNPSRLVKLLFRSGWWSTPQRSTHRCSPPPSDSPTTTTLASSKTAIWSTFCPEPRKNGWTRSTKDAPQGMDAYGTHILGELHDAARVKHLDGQDTQWRDH